MKNDHISAHLEVPKSVRADAGYTITLENKLQLSNCLSQCQSHR